MVKRLLSELERLAQVLQTRSILRRYPSLSGIKLGPGFLWQHPRGGRQKILDLCKRRLVLDSRV